MPERRISPEQMDALFGSAQFIKKVEASGKLSADVFLEASDTEVAAWLKEGTEAKRKMEQEIRKKHGA